MPLDRLDAAFERLDVTVLKNADEVQVAARC
jgi:hypothetical protein